MIVLMVAVALPAGARSQAPGTTAKVEVTRDVVEMMAEPRLKLLTNKPVQDELTLTTDQKGKLSDLYKEVRDFVRADVAATAHETLAKLSKEERMAVLKKSLADEDADRARTRKKIEGILLPKQLERLNQILLQLKFQNPRFALVDPDVVKLLAISGEQKAKIVAINRSGAGLNAWRPGGELPSTQDMKKLVDAQKQQEAKVMDILTVEQKKNLDKMLGPKFDLSLLRGRPNKPGR